MKVSWIFRRWG